LEVRLERLPAMRAAHVHAFSESPEEDAWGKMEAWAEANGLLGEGAGTRVFGRNTYPTDEPEPYGYEFFLTVGPDVEAGGEIDIYEIPGGLYAVLGFKGLDNIGEAWERIWNWIGGSKYDHVGWLKGEHGWCNGYEENLTPLEKDPNKWVFDLWVQLKE
jgi:effector-binding domain-containing protein